MVKIYGSVDVSIGDGVRRDYKVTLSPKKSEDIPENYLKRFQKEIVKDAKNCLKTKAEEMPETVAGKEYPTTFTFDVEDSTVKKLLKKSFSNYKEELERGLKFSDIYNTNKTIERCTGGITCGSIGGCIYALYTNHTNLSRGFATLGFAAVGILLLSKQIAKPIAKHKENKRTY